MEGSDPKFFLNLLNDVDRDSEGSGSGSGNESGSEEWQDSDEDMSEDVPSFLAVDVASPKRQHEEEEARERSPLKSDVASPSPPCTPLSNQRSPVDRRARGTHRVVSRGGQQRGRGSGRGRGRGSRAARATEGESGWRWGESVKEVCLDDKDIPASLQEIIERTERNRREGQMRERRRERRRNVRENEDDDDEDEVHDAGSAAIVQELFGGDRGAVEFTWSPMATFSGRAEEFQPKKPGPAVSVSGPYDAFRVYWDDSILKHIVRETNRYAAELKASSVRFARDWYDTNVHEIMILFAFWMMLGIIRMPSIKACFSSNFLLRTDIYRKLMTEARYWNLTRALHFVNEATWTPDSSKLFSLGPLVDHLNAKFKSAYVLDQKITIDESLTLWKGSLSFRQYIKTKAARFGIKTFELCESSTGYLWSFEIYTGKDTNAQSRMPKSTEIVVRLMRPLLNKGHQLFLDNWYNSPVLARFLKRNKTDCVGTLRKYRKNVPALLQHVRLPEQGTCIARHSGDVVLMVYQDKKPVYTISTCHGVESVQIVAKPGRPAHYKPAVIADYNVSMGGVDKKDQMLEPFLLERKRNRDWYKKMFKRLLNASIFNSRILLDKSIENSVKHQAFRLELVNEIINHHLHLVPQGRVRQTQTRHSALPAERLIGRNHFMVRLPTSDTNRGSLGRRGCMWCTVVEQRFKRTIHMCEVCEVPLCYEGCFKRFHTRVVRGGYVQQLED